MRNVQTQFSAVSGASVTRSPLSSRIISSSMVVTSQSPRLQMSLCCLPADFPHRAVQVECRNLKPAPRSLNSFRAASLRRATSFMFRSGAPADMAYARPIRASNPPAQLYSITLKPMAVRAIDEDVLPERNIEPVSMIVVATRMSASCCINASRLFPARLRPSVRGPRVSAPRAQARAALPQSRR